MTDSPSPTQAQDDLPVTDTFTPEADEQAMAQDANALDAAFAQAFRMPTSLETSPDGNWLVWLQPGEGGDLELWLSGTSEGSEPHRVDLPFMPVEDRDPESGRLVRGPQFSPDSTRIAITGTHPDGDRTAIWIVPMAPGNPVMLETNGEGDGETAPPVVDGTDDIPLEEVEAGAGDDSMPVETVDVSSPGFESDVDLLTEPGDAFDMDVEPTLASQDGVEDDLLAGEKPFMLANHSGSDRSPRWSPDGEIIAFTSTIDGRDVIALGSPREPGGIEMLTWSREHSREPQWSRDGKFLGFLRPIGGGPEFHDIWSFSLEAGELTNLTGEKAPNVRHSIEWVPGRNLIAFVTIENDWLGVSVVNADNKAGWVVTRESGDKTEPRFAPDEARLVYTRTEGFTTVVCERSLHSSASVALDPGEGVAGMARWSKAKTVAYTFSAPQQPLTIFVQENTAKAERVAIHPDLGASARDMNLVQPQPLEFKVGPDETFSGLLYRTSGTSGKVPGIVYLADGPLTTRRGSFQPDEQALASTALAVLSPVVHGASGFGTAIQNDLRDYANTELEITDIAEAARALGKEEGINPNQIALVGHGFGGALALSTAGARPGSFAAVVAIDPVVEWTMELSNADVQWRNWVTGVFGMPLTHADNYALRTPATFSAVLDIPVILVRTAMASESRQLQFQALLDDLDSVGVGYSVIDAPAEPLAATLRRVSQTLAGLFLDGRIEADVVADLGTAEI